MRKYASLSFLLVAWLTSNPRADTTMGWRGNWTGLYPKANPPREWYRKPKGVMTDLRSQANKPKAKVEANAPRVKHGLVSPWLVLGPLNVTDSVKDIDRAQLVGEAAVQPSIGDKSGSLVWRLAIVPPEDPMSFGRVELPWLDFLPNIASYKINQVAYAHTYLYSRQGGVVRAVVEHGHGLKAWLNGSVVYRSTSRAMTLGNYANLSRHHLNHWYMPSPRFDLKLKPGWNRLLLKISSDNRVGYTDMRFCLRLIDLPTVSYESKNIAWMTELPGRSNATPIVVGHRLFVMAEPDELLCLNKTTGKILWTASVNYYQALTTAELKKRPEYGKKIDPLLAKLSKEMDEAGRVKLRAQIQEALMAFDSEQFKVKADGHFESHFGIVGFTTPTPVSDGKHVYVWCGLGVAACFDLDGKRQWITRVDREELSYASSPALMDGVLAVFLKKLIGLDARTGKVRWRQPKINRNNGSIIPARLAGTAVFISQHGHVVRASDGKVLYRARGQTSGDTGWAPPVVLGQVMYLPNYGVTQLNVVDFSEVKGDNWKPKITPISLPEIVSRKANGGWIDRWTAGSPLIHNGLAYSADIYGSIYAIDLKTRRMGVRQQMAVGGLFHYNALPVAASLALIGKHIIAQDNQGTALVLVPGIKYQVHRRNRIATQLDRWWPIAPQETLSYCPPVADGNRLYLRGEKYLYCIGEK